MRLRRLLAVLVLAGAALPACSQGPAVDDPPTDLVIAAGEASGVYYRYGQGLAEALSADLPSTTVRARVTSGSVDNVVLLARREAALAFALADTAAEAVAGTGPFPEPVPLRALGRLYTNSVHVVVPDGSPVDRVADLRGRRVSVGAAGSGTELTATRLLAVAGLGAPSAVQVVRAGVQESARALADGRLDAFFWSGGLPTEGVAELVERAERLGVLDAAAAERTGSTVEQVQAESRSRIPAGRYGRPEEFGAVAAFLCSELAGYVTGVALRVDGGLVTHL